MPDGADPLLVTVTRYCVMSPGICTSGPSRCFVIFRSAMLLMTTVLDEVMVWLARLMIDALLVIVLAHRVLVLTLAVMVSVPCSPGDKIDPHAPLSRSRWLELIPKGVGLISVRLGDKTSLTNPIMGVVPIF